MHQDVDARHKAVHDWLKQSVTRPNSIEKTNVSAPGGVTPGLVPVLARGIDDAAVGLEELVGDLEDREHQPTFRTPCDVAAARLAPDEFARPGLDALRRALLFDNAAVEDA